MLAHVFVHLTPGVPCRALTSIFLFSLSFSWRISPIRRDCSLSTLRQSKIYIFFGCFCCSLQPLLWGNWKRLQTRSKFSLNKNSFVLNHSCNSLQKNYGWHWLSHWIVTDVLSLFSITTFPLFSKDRCASRKKNSGFALRRILGVKHTRLAPRVPRRALRVFFVFFFCVCLFFLTLEIDFAAKEWLLVIYSKCCLTFLLLFLLLKYSLKSILIRCSNSLPFYLQVYSKPSVFLQT